MMHFFNNKSLVIALAVFIVVAVLAAGLIFYFNRADMAKVNPSVKRVLAVIPGINKKIDQSEKMSEIEKQQKLIEEQKNKIQAEWDSLNERDKELAAKEQLLDKREQELTAKESEVMAAQQKSETNLKNIKDIAQYYELMDPGNAAKIFATMDENLIIQIFQNMKKESVSQILSSMDSQKAASITKKMSGI